MKKLQKPSGEVDDESLDIIEDCNYPSIFFHKLESNKIDW